MRKRNKLYTANKYNQPLFMQDLQKEEHNLFDGGGPLLSNMASIGSQAQSYYPNWQQLWQQQQGNLANSKVGQNMGMSGTGSHPYLTSTPPNISSSQLNNSLNTNNLGTTPKLTPAPSIENPNKGTGKNVDAAQQSGFGGWQAAIATAGSAAADNIPIEGTRSGLFDAADPVYWMADGRESAVGNGLSDAGVATFKAGVQSGNPWVMLAGAGLKVSGGLVNAAWGIKTDKKRLNLINSGIDTLKGYKSDATDFDDVVGPSSIVNNTQDIYEGGWFSKGKAARKNAELTEDVRNVEAAAQRSLQNNVTNISATQMDDLKANYAAFGGPLGNSSGAIDYSFISDYLTNKRRITSIKDKVSASAFSSPTFALGGVMQTNGGDFSDGLTMINAGGSHEENPYEGVQMGISKENGQPNLVEEGETVFDDYVFSKRIKLDERAKKKFHVGKNSDVTYADMSKRLEKESAERPNDPVSLASLKKQMYKLADEQERQKEEQQKEEMQDAFAQLPPEQQQAIMQQLAMEEQQAAETQQEEAAMQQEQQAPNQNLSAEQQQILAQQQAQGQQGAEEQMLQEQPQAEEIQMAACGGKLNKFDKGGDMKRNLYRTLRLATDKDFDNWRKKYSLDEITDWENILENEAFMDALKKSSPALRHALSDKYDFGVFKPTTDGKLTFDFKHGGWGLEDYGAWEGSTDEAWQEALKGVKQADGTILKVAPGMGSEEIGKILSQTNAYKRGTDWLKADEKNRLAYLQAIANSDDAPDAAREYAKKYVDANGWLKDAKTDYQTIFEDPNGTGVRNTHPGTYWKTPKEVLRGKTVKNFEVDNAGNVYEIYNDVPKDWTPVDNYSWQNEEGDLTYNYYKRPAVKAEEKGKDDDTEIVPVHKSTWQRGIGAMGPGLALAMMKSGFGAPDYSRMEAAKDMASEAPVLAHYKPVGNYLTYKPMDIWYEQNRLNANSRATDRAITNNGSPLGTKIAGLLANGYNNQIASGDLFRKALEYNDAQRQKVEEFNRATNMYNADAFTKTSATNAGIINDHRKFKTQLALDVAKERLNTDASWYSNMYKNLDGMFKGIADIGKENAQHNMIADMAADNLFGTITDRQNIGNGYIVRKLKRKGNTSAKGGKINRKKGLTY